MRAEETDQGGILQVVIREARRRQILMPHVRVAKATIYRLFRQRGLMDRQEQIEDRRRFEAELPNDIWQSDCMHGPMVVVEGRQRKTFTRCRDFRRQQSASCMALN